MAAATHDPVLRDLDARLRREPVVWLSSVTPDGRPHVVPIWFTWDGTVFWVFSKPGAVKVRNLRADARAMLALGEPVEDFDVQLIEGRATLLEAPTATVLPEAHRRKYARKLRGLGIGWEEYAATYSQALRIEPTRFLPWRGRSHQAEPPSAARSWRGLLERVVSALAINRRPAPQFGH